ncbi:hypothetical protein J3A83DRAFT_4187138 [Scleroderma citrinum]
MDGWVQTRSKHNTSTGRNLIYQKIITVNQKCLCVGSEPTWAELAHPSWWTSPQMTWILQLLESGLPTPVVQPPSPLPTLPETPLLIDLKFPQLAQATVGRAPLTNISPITNEHAVDMDYFRAATHLTDCYQQITGTSRDRWPAFFAAVQTDTLDCTLYNATATMIPIPNSTFILISVDSDLWYYLAEKKVLLVNHPLFSYMYILWTSSLVLSRKRCPINDLMGIVRAVSFTKLWYTITE